MAIVRARVNCARCRNPVDKSQTVLGRNSAYDKEYVCFHCYNIGKHLESRDDERPRVKVDLYCERCKYRFKGFSTLCPYCNSSDMVSKGDVTMKDLAIERFM